MDTALLDAAFRLVSHSLTVQEARFIPSRQTMLASTDCESNSLSQIFKHSRNACPCTAAGRSSHRYG